MNPYENLPEKAFWKLAVANKSMFDVAELWDPKFRIFMNQNVATFGSCFAQYIGKALQKRGFCWLDTEPAPYGMLPETARRFSYDVFSARTGNLYTTSLLKQWTEWALDKKPVPDEYWTNNGRYVDPFRPRVEPNGFDSLEEMRASRLHTIRAFRACIEQAHFFVFTLGLTESWMNAEKGYEYPMCPGTVAGEFDESQHRFVNQGFSEILNSLKDAIELMRQINPRLRFILTVSPVPLTATCSGKHVAVATMASKSILRAVADQMSNQRRCVDYFPSYEIINSPIYRGTFFEPNQRSVNPHGVEFVMNSFFDCLERKFGSYDRMRADKQAGEQAANEDSLADKHCEEELLEAFAK